MLSKWTDFTGRNLQIPLIYGNPQGRSATFTTAQTRSTTSSKLIDFLLTRVKDYSVFTIDSEVMFASQGNPGAFLSAAEVEVEGAINSLAQSCAIAEYRDGSGSIGQVLAAPSNHATTFTITLLNSLDIASFEVGMDLVVWSAASGGSQRTSDGSALDFPVVAVDRDAGTLTVTGTYSGSGTMAANDYIFQNGDRGLKLSGLEAWVPGTAPTSAAFFSVDRSADVVRLGGSRYDARGLPIEEALIEGASKVNRLGQKIDYYFVNYETYSGLERSLGSKVIYIDHPVNTEISFRGIRINTGRGPVDVIPDQNCQGNIAWGLNLASWRLNTLGQTIRPIENDGLTLLRLPTADGVEGRYTMMGNLSCNAPGSNVRVLLS